MIQSPLKTMQSKKISNFKPKHLTIENHNLTISPQNKKWTFKGLQSTAQQTKRKSALGQTLQPLPYSPEIDSQQKQRSKSQLKISERFNVTAVTKGFDFQLPKIRPNRKDPKKGPYLQNWLDEALSSDIKQESCGQKNIFKGALKNVRGFQLDRLFLQSQNIPHQTVDRLYKSLYIYSHGIDKVFQELLSSLKMNITDENIKNSPQQRLLNSFWKAFSRLLQNCSSYQTAYQIVEKKHLTTIKELKQKMFKIQETNEQKERQHLNRIHKLQKQLQQFLYKYGKLQTQYKILQSTYSLTDQTFNDEVSLRLKFQQKINAVYTSYNQLKNKYQALLDKLQISNHVSMQQRAKQQVLSKQIQKLNVKINALQLNLSNQKHKTTALAQQLQVKSQQLEDIKVQNIAKQQKQLQGQDIMTQLIQKNKILQTKHQDINKKYQANNKIIAQQKQFIQNLNQKVDNIRQINDRLYQRVANNQETISQLQNQLNQKNYKLDNQQVQISQMIIKITEYQSNLQNKSQSISTFQTKADILNKRIENQQSIIQKNNNVIQQLKAVKDKYQRLNALFKRQKQQIQEMYNQNLQKVVDLQQEKQGLKMLLTAKDGRIKQLQTNILRQKQISASKVASIQLTLTKKQASILSYTKLSQQNNTLLQDKNYHIQKIQSDLTNSKNDILRKDLQISQLKAKLSAVQKQQKQTSKQYKELNQKYQKIMKRSDQLSSQLSSKTYLLQMKKDQKDSQLNSITLLLQQYKIKVVERASYIHPMLYEDLLYKTIRSQQNKIKAIKIKQQYQKENQQFLNLKQEYIDKIKLLQEIVQSLKDQLQIQRDKGDRLASAASRQRNQKRKLLDNNKQNQLTQKLQRKIEEIEKLLKEKSQLTQKIDEHKNLNSQLRKSSEKYRYQIEELNKKIQVFANISKTSRQIQTDQIQKSSKQFSISSSNYSSKRKGSDKQVQTQLIVEEKQQIINQTPENFQPVQSKKPEKKIEAKQMRKALKFTYMRR